MARLFDPFPKQEEFLQAVFSFKHRYLLYGGGVGGGKSFATLGTMLTLLAVFPGSKGVCFRDTYPNLKLTSIESWKKLIHDEIGPQSFITSYNQTERIFYCSNGSQLQFIAEDFANQKDLGHFKGLEFNFAILEEASELQEQTFHKCIERCGRHLPPNGVIPPPIIMLTTNPTNGWVRRIFYDPARNGTLPPDYYYLPALLEDNTYLMENTAYVESSKANMPAYLYRKFFLGDWDIEEPAENRIYRCFDPDVHIATIPYNPDLPLHISFDENVNPFMSLVAFQIVMERDATGTIVIKHVNLVDEILGRHPNNTVVGICNLFKKKYHFHKAGLFIYGDATSRKADTKIESGHNLFTLIEGYLSMYKPVLRILKSNPSVVMRTSFYDAVLEKEISDIRFRIDTHCNESINDFIKTRTDSDGNKLKEVVRDPKTKVSYQAHGHLTDCCDYFLCSAFASEYQKYLKGGRPWTAPKMGKNPVSKYDYSYQKPSGSNIKMGRNNSKYRY